MNVMQSCVSHFLTQATFDNVIWTSEYISTNNNNSQVILICTPDLLESREAEYLWQVAEHTAVEQATRMILPIMFKV